MLRSDISKLWQSVAGDIAPLAHVLRADLNNRWVRFHSLPDSIRYADTNEQCNLILDRHNEILHSIWNAGDPIVILTTREGLQFNEGIDSHWRALSGNAIIEFNEYRWEKGVLNAMILGAADEELWSCMVINVISSDIYHPYDGGLDLFLAKADRIPEMKQIFEKYLSHHPDGL